MNLFKRKNTKNIDADIQFLEHRLDELFQPILPRNEFVNDLRLRLASREIPASQSMIPKSVSNGILIAGGVLGSVLMIVTGVRGIISLVSLIGLIVQYFNRETQNQQITAA